MERIIIEIEYDKQTMDYDVTVRDEKGAVLGTGSSDDKREVVMDVLDSIL